MVFRAAGEKTVYLAGNTVWCAVASDALTKYRPDVMVLSCVVDALFVEQPSGAHECSIIMGGCMILPRCTGPHRKWNWWPVIWRLCPCRARPQRRGCLSFLQRGGQTGCISRRMGKA